jgi:hypothetical protein
VIAATPVEQAMIGVVIGFPSAALGYLAYKRSRKVDAISAQSGAVSENRAGMTQIIESLNQLIDNLQDDNKSFRDDIRFLTGRLDVTLRERDDLRREVDRLYRRYGNGTPPGGMPVITP